MLEAVNKQNIYLKRNRINSFLISYVKCFLNIPIVELKNSLLHMDIKAFTIK